MRPVLFALLAAAGCAARPDGADPAELEPREPRLSARFDVDGVQLQGTAALATEAYCLKF